VPASANHAQYFAEADECLLERSQAGQLAADMDRHPCDLDPRERARFRIGRKCLIRRNPELVVDRSRRDLGMRSRFHVRIDPEADRGDQTQGRCN
jgi:hypothetical protein